MMAGWGLVWLRLYYAGKVAERFKAATAAGVLTIRHHFWDAQEVEIVARLVCIPAPSIVLCDEDCAKHGMLAVCIIAIL